jgi:hypothetical protein
VPTPQYPPGVPFDGDAEHEKGESSRLRVSFL